MFLAVITLLVAMVLSMVAAYFSVAGMMALFAANAIGVGVMMASLEVGKLVAASWLKTNWHNRKVGLLHKTYLILAVVVLMIITGLGIYGFLAKGHLEQEAPLAGVELQIARIEQRVAQTREERDRMDVRLKQLDQSINTILNNSKTTRDAQAALRARQQQQKERDQIRSDLTVKDTEINKLTDELVPLRTSVNDVSAKLGPVKYVAKLFGWTDVTTAVQLVILLIMFAFDPLAVVLLLSGTITMSEWFEQRRPKEVVSLPPLPAPEDSEDDQDDRPTDAILRGAKLLDEMYGQSSADAPDQIVVVPAPKSDREALIEILERNPQFLSMLADATEAEPEAEPDQVETETSSGNSETEETKIDKPVDTEIASVTETANTAPTGFTAWAREIVRGGSK